MFGCGNTFFPKFFPKRLKRYRKEDLAVGLIRKGLAVPTIEIFKNDPAYANQLINALVDAAPKLELQKGHADANALGSFLVSRYPEFFATGAWLLAHTNDLTVISIVKNHMKQLVLKTQDLPESRCQQKMNELARILIKVSPQDAREVMQEFIREHKNHFPYTKVDFALTLMTLEDMFGMDHLMSEIVDPNLDVTYRASIANTFVSKLRFYWRNGDGYHRNHHARMVLWYKENRAKLNWDDDRQEMTFPADDSSGSEYFQSMEKYHVIRKPKNQ